MIYQPLRVSPHELMIDIEILIKRCGRRRHHARPFHFHRLTPLNESNSPHARAEPAVAPTPPASQTETQRRRRKPAPGMVPCRSASATSPPATNYVRADVRTSRLHSDTQLSPARVTASVRRAT